jgi:glycosyltransferase involved in cell wall biosynthesis
MAAFARYLPEYGWQPTVLSGPCNGPRIPPADGIDRIGATGWAPPPADGPSSQRRTWRDVVRAHLVPDHFIRWVPQAIRQGMAWLSQHPGAPIVSSGPYHSCHLVALALQRRTGARWIADFRDPWAANPIVAPFPGPLQRLNEFLERTVLRAADRVVVVSPADRRVFSPSVPDERLILLPNGFDPADYQAPPPFEPQPELVLRHFGSLFGHQEAGGNNRRIHSLLRAIEALSGDGRPCRLELYGQDRLDHPAVRTLPPLPHAEAVALMHRTEVLLLVPGASYALPGKLYEYAATGRPILSLGDPDGESARWIADHGAGMTVGQDDVAGLVATLQAWRVMAMVPPTGLSPQHLAAHDRRLGAGRLADLLDGLLS